MSTYVVSNSLKSLDAATATGAGTTLLLSSPKSSQGIQVLVTGNPSPYEIDLEGSIDGANWTVLKQVNSATGIFVSSTTAIVTMLRANLVSFSGGTSPTFTAFVVGA